MTLQGVKYAYLGEKRLLDRDVLHIGVDGNCCWSMYDKSLFRGEIQFLPLGFAGSPKVDTMSLKKQPCINN